MLSLEKVKSELEKYNYTYNNNILCGHTKSKVKWVLPTGIVNIMAFEQATSYLFGFSDKGINLFPIQGDFSCRTQFVLQSVLFSHQVAQVVPAFCYRLLLFENSPLKSPR